MLHMHRQGATMLQQHATGCFQRGSQAITRKPLRLQHRKEWRTSTRQVHLKAFSWRHCIFKSIIYTVYDQFL